jgi:DNA mismatch repair protein MutS
MDAGAIERRLDAVAEFRNDHQFRSDLRTALGTVYDLERLISRVSLCAANARDLLALKQSFSSLPHIQKLLSKCDSRLVSDMAEDWDDLGEVRQLIEGAIHDDPPYSLREGKLIKKATAAKR